MKRIKINSTLFVVVFLVLSLSGCSLYEAFGGFVKSLDESVSCDIYMFESISELDSMENSFKEYGEVEKYSPSDDEYLNELEYKNSYLARYECDSYEFEIFAYEFQSTEDARQYYSNFEKDKIDEDVWRLYKNLSGDVTIIAWNKSNMYRMEYSKENEKPVSDLLSQSLSFEMVWIEDEETLHFECVRQGDR